MELKLQKPIVFFDLETTGVNAIHDRIESSAIHGIYDEDVKDCPTFKQVARDIAAIFVNSDIAGFNSNYFDVPMLVEEMLRAGIDFDITKCRLIDVQNIYHKLEQRTLSAAYKFYCGKNLEDAHSAQADTRATYEVLKAQLDKYPDKLNNDVQFLSSFSKMNDNVDFAGRIIYNDKHIPVFNFGKYKGQSVEDVLARDPGYYGWMMQGDFPQNTKQVLTKLRLKAIGK